MGVTIHFEGRLKSRAEYERCLTYLRDFASDHDWPLREIERKDRKLARVQNEENWDYEGPTEGVELRPHSNSDPMRFEVDSEFFIQEYIKTQFAPIEIHVKISNLLKEISEFFSVISIEDEGEYYESNDIEILRGHLDACFRALDDYLKEHPKAKGPVRLSSGRIADVIQ